MKTYLLIQKFEFKQVSEGGWDSICREEELAPKSAPGWGLVRVKVGWRPPVGVGEVAGRAAHGAWGGSAPRTGLGGGRQGKVKDWVVPT